ncbi:MAG: sterol desaturase [Rhodoferax sp.]|nr:sterol desaturase [Rhodoferax sp.]
MSFITSLQNSLPAWLLHVLQLALWLVLLTALFAPLERWFALHPGKLLRRQIGMDVGYYFLSSLLPAALLSLPVALMATAGQALMPAAWRQALQALPWWALLLAGIVLADFGAYWGHRLCHEIPWLWRFHAIHHSAEHMDFMVNTRAHPVDMVVVRMFALAPVTLLGLGGANAQGSLLPAVITIVAAMSGFFVHANLRCRLGALEWLVTSPAFHHWHHSRVEHINRNYAATFPWIDRIFGTHHLPAEWPSQYGLAEPGPTTLATQLIGPFGFAPGRIADAAAIHAADAAQVHQSR